MDKEIVRLPKVNDSDSQEEGAPARAHTSSEGTSPPGEPVPAVLVAPAKLVAATRAAFRSEALERIEQVAEAGGLELTLDLRSTTEVDASGLGVLVMLRKRAGERGLVLQLLHARDPVRRLLATSKLDTLFRFID
jgi:anti-anti-sigma factor